MRPPKSIFGRMNIVRGVLQCFCSEEIGQRDWVSMKTIFTVYRMSQNMVQVQGILYIYIMLYAVKC